MKIITTTWQRLNVLLYGFLCILFLLFVSACSEADHPSSETGSISFGVDWRGAPTMTNDSDSVITSAKLA